MSSIKWCVIYLSLLIFQEGSSQAQLPHFSLQDMKNNKVDLQELSEDRLIILSLWATWCVPCINELEAISYYYPDWKSKYDLKIYAVSIDDARTVNRVRPMVKGKSWDYDILFDTNNDLRRALGAATVPLTLIVKNNKILYSRTGYSPGAEDILADKLSQFSEE